MGGGCEGDTGVLQSDDHATDAKTSSAARTHARTRQRNLQAAQHTGVMSILIKGFVKFRVN